MKNFFFTVVHIIWIKMNWCVKQSDFDMLLFNVNLHGIHMYTKTKWKWWKENSTIKSHLKMGKQKHLIYLQSNLSHSISHSLLHKFIVDGSANAQITQITEVSQRKKKRTVAQMKNKNNLETHPSFLLCITAHFELKICISHFLHAIHNNRIARWIWLHFFQILDFYSLSRSFWHQCCMLLFIFIHSRFNVRLVMMWWCYTRRFKI